MVDCLQFMESCIVRLGDCLLFIESCIVRLVDCLLFYKNHEMLDWLIVYCFIESCIVRLVDCSCTVDWLIVDYFIGL